MRLYQEREGIDYVLLQVRVQPTNEPERDEDRQDEQ
jgi:hypothetical protein